MWIHLPVRWWQWHIRILCVGSVAFRYNSWRVCDEKFFSSYRIRVSYYGSVKITMVVVWYSFVWTLEFMDSDGGLWNRCSTLQTGDLTKPDRAVDGIFGFGQQDMSVISQLASQGITPRVFSHCLKGDDSGGGILVLGEIVEPNIVYTPLVPSQYVFLPV